ncbi:MAG: hypothetical protein HY867_08265 [Chloroflexi bacterium]|nr:hypothetical protein [Chloroflexota bacterium]
MSRTSAWRLSIALLVILTLTAATWMPAPAQQSINAEPPDHVVKLVFIHHSTGENWLTDGYGDLGRALGENNYFVSDTNYGWGPDAIGDRTDIPNWTEWFASANTPTYMDALFRESGQHASYTRTLSDPGGENEIIIFKSCFPNSALEGNPNDPPGTYEELSVSGAKYVYNSILPYFASRPDKLFIVITAPPLSDSTHAKNARAFNNWLLNDWLSENNYTLNNVAVFDFYNILTGPEAHHRINGEWVEHAPGHRNTLAYPSGDDHPNERGSQKATEEFVPLLNYFYHRWEDSGTASAPPSGPAVGAATEAPIPPEVASGAQTTVGVIDDFEGAPPAHTSGWEGYFQDNTDTQLTCRADSSTAHAGSASLQFQFDAQANTWATCGFYFDTTQNWSAGQGLSFYLRADRAGLSFDVSMYGGSPGGRSTYVYHAQTPTGSDANWVLVQIPWSQIQRAEWEENAGAPFNPAEVTGFSIGLSAPESARAAGTIWLDDLSLLGTEPVAQPSAPTESTPPEESGGGGFNCGGATLVPFALIGFAFFRKRPKMDA